PGTRQIEANQMYMHVDRTLALAYSAEIETVSDRLGGPVFFRAEQLRQVSKDRFIAERTQVTPSRFGIPTYDFETDQITLDDITQPVTNPFTGEAVRDPVTGQPVTETRHRVTGVKIGRAHV